MRRFLFTAALLCFATSAHARGVRFAGNTKTKGVTVPSKRLPPPPAATRAQHKGLEKFNPYPANSSARRARAQATR